MVQLPVAAAPPTRQDSVWAPLHQAAVTRRWILETATKLLLESSWKTLSELELEHVLESEPVQGPVLVLA